MKWYFLPSLPTPQRCSLSSFIFRVRPCYQSRCSLLINSPPGGPAPSRTAAQISYSKQDLSRRFERWSKREQEGRGESLLIDNCGSGHKHTGFRRGRLWIVAHIRSHGSHLERSSVSASWAAEGFRKNLACARTYSCLADPAWEHAYSQMIPPQLTSLFWGFPSFPLTFLKLEATARWKVEPAVGNWRMKLSLPALGYIVAYSLFSPLFRLKSGGSEL